MSARKVLIIAIYVVAMTALSMSLRSRYRRSAVNPQTSRSTPSATQSGSSLGSSLSDESIVAETADLPSLSPTALQEGAQANDESSSGYQATQWEGDHGLHNLFVIGERLYSGSEPMTEADFAALKAQGVTVIVSVDGTEPQVELAEKMGLRYIHIPIGYDQVDGVAVARLQAVARRFDEPIYVHCHHGKHRGPAAAAVLAQIQKRLDTATALEYLKDAGTDPDYRGLWQSVEHLQLPKPGAVEPELVSRSEVEPLPAAMARLEHSLADFAEMVRQDAKQAGAEGVVDAVLRSRWQDQALLVEEGVKESKRSLASDADPELIKAFDEALEAAREMRSSVIIEAMTDNATDEEPVLVVDLAEAVRIKRGAFERHCVSCHREWR